MRIDTDDINRVRATKTPGWRHGTKKRPNPEKRVKATKIRGQRRGKGVSKNKNLAKSYAEHMDKAKRGIL